MTGRKQALIAELNRAAREASGLGNVFANAVAGKLGVSPTDLECLGIVGAGETVTPGDLARATGLTSGAITGVVDRLERGGYVRRVRDTEDRRKVYVRITQGGRTKAYGLYASLSRAVDRLAAKYSAAELEVLVRYFDESRDMMLAEIAKLDG
ncbi:MAG TPA: MarR family transcriptional regulator [Bauldia sp.]|nr:MarR family transcriptional regulator [Bauldia sp.]